MAKLRTARMKRIQTSRHRHREKPRCLKIESLETRYLLSYCSASFSAANPDANCLGYDYDIVAETGSGGFVNFESAVSINDSGNVAYVGEDDLGASSVFFNTTPLSFVRSYGREVQINNSNQVAAVDIVGGQRRARIWDGNNPGSQTILARSSTPRLDTSHFDGMGNFASVANDGQLAFAGLENPTSGNAFWEVQLSDSLVDRRDFLSLDTQVTEFSIPPGVFFRHMAADGDRVVVGSRAGSTRKIVLHDITGLDSSTTIASSEDGWTNLGVRPGISDRGQIVGFHGEPDPGPNPPLGTGIFVSIETSTGRLTRPIADTVNQIAGHAFSGFDADSRVAVSDIKAGTQHATVAFIGTRNGAKGIYTSRINFVTPNGVAFDATDLPADFVVTDPMPVAQVGEIVYEDTDGDGRLDNGEPRLPGTIQNLAIHDPVNNEGTIAFWVQTTTGAKAIVKAQPWFDSPFVDHVVRTPPNPATGLPRPRQSGNTNNDIRQIILHASVGTETELLTSSLTGIGAHYGVSREGRITQFMPEEFRANHALNENSAANRRRTNDWSIGIEQVDDCVPVGNECMVGTGHRDANSGWATTALLSSSAVLVRDIGERQSVPLTHLIPKPYDIFPDRNGNRIDTTPFSIPGHPFPGAGPILPAGPFQSYGDEDGVPDYREGRDRVAGLGGTHIMDGFDITDSANNPVSGIIDHNQVIDRRSAKDDPRIFDWTAFINSVNLGTGWVLNSPADLFVIDPLGRKAGVDPETGTTFSEIPNLQFSGAGKHPQTLAIPNAVEGDYTVRVAGTGDGDYRLDYFTSDIMARSSFSQLGGTTSTGQIETFTYTVQHANASASKAASAVNIAPFVNDDTARVLQDSTLGIDILRNDSDADGDIDVDTIQVTNTPAGSAVFDTQTGKLEYTPPANFTGNDLVQYQLADDEGQTSRVANVHVTVIPDSSPPVALDDSVSAVSGVASRLDILVNDDDPDGTLDVGSVLILNAPDNGTVFEDASTGEVVYKSEPDFVGTVSFLYIVSDNSGYTSNIAEVTVAVAEPTTPWQNSSNALDVNGDSFVAPNDVLLVIDYVNANPNNSDLPAAPSVPPPFLDTSGDNRISPIDALLVINHLNRPPTEAEGGPTFRLFGPARVPLTQAEAPDPISAADDEMDSIWAAYQFDPAILDGLRVPPLSDTQRARSQLTREDENGHDELESLLMLLGSIQGPTDGPRDSPS